MSISIGGNTLDASSSPVVNLNYEYYKTKGGEIIGGVQKYTITGTISVSGNNSPTGSQVMAALASIRNFGREPKCVSVSIPGFFSGKGKITNVSIEQGPDPSWINQGAYSIEITAPLTSIPTNSLGLTANDSVKDVSKLEKIELGEECHGFVYDSAAGILSKTFAKFTNEVTLSWQPICSDTATPLLTVLNKLISIGPTLDAFSQFSSWGSYLQSRSFSINTDGSVSFKSEMVLIPPGASASAFVDISFELDKNYTSKTMSKKITGSINGLASVGWGGIVNLSDTSSASKLSGAETAFSSIKGAYSSLSSWSGLDLELTKLPLCPKPNTNAACADDPEDEEIDTCLIPLNSNISKNRTEGSITFDFEWASAGEACEENGINKEITVEVTEPQVTFQQFVIPDFGTLLQNLNCRTAETVQGTCTIRSSGRCIDDLDCNCETALEEKINEYVPDKSKWLLITHSKQKTSNSLSLTKKYIRRCIQ